MCQCSSDIVILSRCFFHLIFFFQAEDGIRDLVRSRGLGDVYKRQGADRVVVTRDLDELARAAAAMRADGVERVVLCGGCLLYTSDAADERSSVDLGGSRIIKKKKISMNVCASLSVY